MEKKIIFFDIDDTLLDSEKQIPQKTKEAIFLLKKSGHEVAIATGRAPYMFEEIRKELDITTYVSFNGQYVVVDGELIYSNPLDKMAFEELTVTASEMNHPLIYMDEYEMKMSVPGHRFIDESMGSLKLSVVATHDPDFFKGRNIYQAQIFCVEQEENRYVDAFKEFKFTRWHPLSVDIDPSGGTKANGIKQMLEMLGFPLESAYAFGDGLNDVEMLKLIPNSFAMGNGEEEAQKAARFITKSVNEDGIWHGLKMAGLI